MEKQTQKIVEFKNVRKEFFGGKIVANDNLSFFIKEGTVHAIAGENGAGKSTLLSMLFGLYKPTKGEIFVKGKKINYSSAASAVKDGIGMVQQHFQLVDKFTVSENIVLGSEESKLTPFILEGYKKEIKKLKTNKNNLKIKKIKKIIKNNKTTQFGFIKRKEINKRVNEVIKKYNFNVTIKQKISQLSVGQEQKVEILKLLYKNSDILIFDEPTAVLTPNEIDELIKIILDLKKNGKTIIIITHKLEEMKKVADEVSVLRLGKYIGTRNVKSITAQELSNMMVGKKIVANKLLKKTPGKKILEVKNLTVIKNKVKKLKNVSFSLKEGEILTVAGVEGNGQTELIESITGLIKYKKGDITFKDENIKKLSIFKRNKKMAHIPEDRHKFGMILDLLSYENIIIKRINKHSFFGILNRKSMKDYSRKKVIKKFDIRGTDNGIAISRGLSGGNQQKLVVGREIASNKKLLIVFQATRGLDVGAINYIHKQIISARTKGAAVLVVSYDINEVIALSDRILVFNSGSIIGEFKGKDINKNKIGVLMSKGEKNE